MLDRLLDVLRTVNVASRDNGIRFVDETRRDAIASALKASPYRLVHRGPLALVYAHAERRPKDRIVAVSSHVDSLYDHHFATPFSETEIVGSFDNSLTNASLVALAVENRLHPNVMLAFTGDEESDSRGAVEVMEFFGSNRNMWHRLEMVVTLDVTYYRYKSSASTIEDRFVRRAPRSLGYALSFARKRDLAAYLAQWLPDVPVLGDKAPDESWEYDEYNLNCFSFCLPTTRHPQARGSGWMESPLGIRVRTASFEKYTLELGKLCRGIGEDLARRSGGG